MFNVLLKPWIQGVLIIVTTLFLFFTSSFKIKSRKYYDHKPGLIETLNKRKSETDVIVTLNIQNFIKSDFIKNNFIVDLNLWFEFDPKQITLDEVSKFSFSKGEILEKSDPVIAKDKKLTKVRYDLRVKFLSNLNHKYFPLETHRLYLTLNNKFIDLKNVNFILDHNSFNTSKSIYAPAWQFVGSNSKSGSATFMGTNGENIVYPRIIFELDFIQDSMRNFIFLFLPMLVILLISLCAFALNLKVYFSDVLDLASAGVLGMLAYRYVIEEASPKVSYFMLSDHIFTTCLMILFAIFFVGIFYRQRLDKNRGLLVLILYATIYLAWSYLIFAW